MLAGHAKPEEKEIPPLGSAYGQLTNIAALEDREISAHAGRRRP
jgi:hypothetical protein